MCINHGIPLSCFHSICEKEKCSGILRAQARACFVGRRFNIITISLCVWLVHIDYHKKAFSGESKKKIKKEKATKGGKICWDIIW